MLTPDQLKQLDDYMATGKLLCDCGKEATKECLHCGAFLCCGRPICDTCVHNEFTKTHTSFEQYKLDNERWNKSQIKIKNGFKCVCSFCKAELPHSDNSATVVSHGMCNPPCQAAIDMGWGEVMDKKSTIAGLVVASLFVALSFVSCAHAATIDAKFLDALAIVESNNNPKAIGDNGRSHGAYQIQRTVWCDVNKSRDVTMRLSFGESHGRYARDFAFSHLTNLNSHLVAATGTNPTPAQLYAAWNLGLTGFRRRDFLLSRCPIKTQRAAAKLNTILNKP